MQRNFRNVIALTLFSVMIIGSPILILAEETGQANASGVAQMEGFIKPDVYQVVLPTDVNGIFDFVLDPQKLIEETNAEAYGGKTFEKGATVFFHRSDGRMAEEYSSSSDSVTISNRSTVPVDVLVEVSISPDSLGNITLTDDRGFTDDTGTSLYMALTDGKHIVPVKTEGSSIQTTIPAAPGDAFKYIYNQERGEYSYELKEDLSGIPFPEYSFQLTGAANEKGDWSTVRDVAPLVNVIWKVTPGQNLDSGENNNASQNADSESSPAFSQILKTIPVEKAEEADIVQDNIPFVYDDDALAGQNHQDTDAVLNSDPVWDKDTDLEADGIADRKNVSEERIPSDTNVGSGEDRAPDILKDSYTLKPEKSVSIDVDLGSGSRAATKVISVRWKETDKELLEMENDTEAVRYKEGKLLFSEAWVNQYLVDKEKQPAVLVVTFDDTGKTEKEIVLN